MPRSRTDDRDQAPQNSKLVVFIMLGALAVTFLCVCGSVGVWLLGLAALNVGPEGADRSLPPNLLWVVKAGNEWKLDKIEGK